MSRFHSSARRRSPLRSQDDSIEQNANPATEGSLELTPGDRGQRLVEPGEALADPPL